jgi:hypothetical protein
MDLAPSLECPVLHSNSENKRHTDPPIERNIAAATIYETFDKVLPVRLATGGKKASTESPELEQISGKPHSASSGKEISGVKAIKGITFLQLEDTAREGLCLRHHQYQAIRIAVDWLEEIRLKRGPKEAEK